MNLNLFFTPTDILLPAHADMRRWSVIACDQFTADAGYWQAVQDTVCDAPSTLRLMLPEFYLGKCDEAAATREIQQTMRRYLDDGVFRTVPHSLVLVQRTLPGGAVRCGVVGALDLEAYDYAPDSVTPIRATEGTVGSRLPARVRIRAAAALENLRQRAGHDPRLTVRQGDIRCLPPETPYDAMVFCLFGDVEEALTVARQQCRGTVLLIRRDYAYHRFSTGRVPVGFTAADSEDTLRHLGLSYRMERFSLEFGQPFRSLEDAQRFFRLYDRSGGVEPPLHRLVPGPEPEFPYYLPNRKDLCLLAVEIPAMEEA